MDEAARAFGFLTAEGFVAGQAEAHRLLYVSAEFAVEVLYDEREGRVLTILDADVRSSNVRAGLDCLFVEAGLGAAQRVRDTARSRKTLRPVLESQADAPARATPFAAGRGGAGSVVGVPRPMTGAQPPVSNPPTSAGSLLMAIRVVR